MSDKPAEYLKRTCLICGCHTNQTINIYEPRSGPNIVELIQAKFKFQPLNEDKYLCFSCNNWLINWHSLQALNSNDAESESPSGTFRSHMNSMVQEKGAGSQHMAQQKQDEPATHRRRLVAQVRPRQLLEAEKDDDDDEENATQSPAQIPQPKFNKCHNRMTCYSKRSFRLNHRLRRRIHHKFMQACGVCGRAIVLRMRAHLKSKPSIKKSIAPAATKCRKCREVCQWRALYLRSLAKAERVEATRRLQDEFTTTVEAQSLVNIQTNVQNSQSNAQNQHHQSLLRRPLVPLVDGKVVSMLR